MIVWGLTVIACGVHAVTSFTPQVATPYFDKVLSRQYARLRKAGVQPWTWLQSHLQLCALVLPLAEVERVMSAKGNWAAVASKVSSLMQCGTLGSTIFTFAGLMVNASQYKQKLEELLDTLFSEESVTEEAINQFKKDAEEASSAFKAISSNI